MGQIKFIGAIVMTLLFAIAILGYATDFGTDNNVAVSLSDNSELQINKAELESNTQSYKTETNSTLQALFDSEISSGDETTRTGGQFKGGVAGAFSAVKNILTIGSEEIFGSEQEDKGKGIILTGLISFLGFVLGLYIWKTWRGNPD